MESDNFENDYWTSYKQNITFRHKMAFKLIMKGPVLDLGCGDGLFLEMLKTKNIEGTGLDVSNVAIESCKQRGLKAEVFDFTNNGILFADDSFENVVLLDVLEHLYFPEKLLLEAKRISKGSVIISVPNFNSLPARLQVLFGSVPENNRPKKGHLYWFNLQILSQMVKKCGLQIEFIQCNTFWENKFVLGKFMSLLCVLRPDIFALSFVVKLKYD